MMKTTKENNHIQLALDSFSQRPQALVQYPATRYQGSKRKIIGWIEESIRNIEFDSALDCFGGTGIVSHMLKKMGKAVTYNDYLKANYIIGKALIENSGKNLREQELEQITKPRNDNYERFIEKTFEGTYFTDEENRQLDITVQNIHRMSNEYEQAIAFFALFQSCIIKRPYNLFHRKNLYMRTSEVPRSFGNKVTWDGTFEEYMHKFTKEANAAVFDNGRENRALNKDVFDIPTEEYDLVYIDPPYVSPKGIGVDYRDFYHFLEGLVDYYSWGSMIDWTSKHRRLKVEPNPWTKPTTVTSAFEALFEKFKDSILVVSYRSPGIPSKNELEDLLLSLGKHVQTQEHAHKYALTKKKTQSSEMLLIAT